MLGAGFGCLQVLVPSMLPLTHVFLKAPISAWGPIWPRVKCFHPGKVCDGAVLGTSEVTAERHPLLLQAVAGGVSASPQLASGPGMRWHMAPPKSGWGEVCFHVPQWWQEIEVIFIKPILLQTAPPWLQLVFSAVIYVHKFLSARF